VVPGFPCCCDCPCRCDYCTTRAPARYKVVISGLTAATSADVNTTESTTCPPATFENDAHNLDPCSDCGDIDGTYIFYHGATDDPKCGDSTSGEELCYWKPLASALPSDCGLEDMRLEVKAFWNTPTETTEIDYFQLTMTFSDYCENGSTDIEDCKDGGGELDEVFYSAQLFWEGWLGDYEGHTCCNIVDFEPGTIYQSSPGQTYYDANGDCNAVEGPDLGYHRKCTARGVTGSVKITALED